MTMQKRGEQAVWFVLWFIQFGCIVAVLLQLTTPPRSVLREVKGLQDNIEILEGKVSNLEGAITDLRREVKL